jgi:HPt (histidine-containing phosphotransfer) domain-containing protein
MEEPNLSFIKEIAGEDEEFQNNLLAIIKKEFSVEAEMYKVNFVAKNYTEAANDVHKIKHKISLLGLKKGLETASHLESQLKNGETKFHNNFLEILNKIHVYLYD